MCHEHTGFDIPNILNIMANQFIVDVVWLLSHVRLFATPRTAACQTLLSSTISQTLLKFTAIQSVMPTNHLILCRPFFCLQSFPGSWSFPVSWLFISGAQSTGASDSVSVIPMNIQGLFPLGLAGLILLSKGLSRVLSSTNQNYQFPNVQLSL